MSNSNAAGHPYTIGETYLVRGVTMYTLGRLRAVYEKELVFEDASWVASTGRWGVALSTGCLSEVEVVPSKDTVIVSRGAIMDVALWRHPLPMITR